jgi:hypothetical protein
MPRNEIGLKTGREEVDITNEPAIRLIVAPYLELRWDPSRRHSHGDRSDSWTNVGDVCSAHRFFTASAFTSSQPHRDRPLGKEQNETKQAKRAAKTFLVWSSTLMTPAVLVIRGCTSGFKDSTAYHVLSTWKSWE